MQGDGARIVYALLKNSSLYYEFRRASSLSIQWPYLLWSFINGQSNIDNTRSFICFTYALFPAFVICFYVLWSLFNKDWHWFWLSLGLTTFCYLPQGINHFNFVNESSYAFLFYFFLKENQKRFNRYFFIILKFLILISFYFSHEISILYTLVISFFSLKNYLKLQIFTQEKIFSFLEFFFGLILSISIFLAYLKMPSPDWIDWSYHFTAYLRGEELWIIILIWLALIVEVSDWNNLNKKIAQLGLFSVWFIPMGFNFFYPSIIPYPFRLLTSILTSIWVMTNYFNKRILELNFSKICICSIMIIFSFRDLNFSQKWRGYRE